MGEVPFRDGLVALATLWLKPKTTGEVDLLPNRLLLRVILLVLKVPCTVACRVGPAVRIEVPEKVVLALVSFYLVGNTM